MRPFKWLISEGFFRSSKVKLIELCALLLPLAMALGPLSASAQITISNGCMEDIAGFSLVCTANDVRIASAQDIKILDDGCAYAGDTVDFKATFEVLLGAQERHDIGLYFATDGDPNLDGAITGSGA